MTEPHLDFDSELVDLTRIDLADLPGLEGSVLGAARTRLEEEASRRDQVAKFSSSI